MFINIKIENEGNNRLIQITSLSSSYNNMMNMQFNMPNYLSNNQNLQFNNNQPQNIGFNNNITHPNNNINNNTQISVISKFKNPPKVGLVNIGSTCYMNATLQCFCQIEELVSFLNMIIILIM